MWNLSLNRIGSYKKKSLNTGLSINVKGEKDVQVKNGCELFKRRLLAGTVAYICNPCNWEVEGGTGIQVSLRSCLKNQTRFGGASL